MAIKSKIHFFFEKATNLPHRNRLKDFLSKMFKANGKELEYTNYVFCSDSQLLSINKQYLNHDYYTDIITFNLSNKPGAIEAEIYISVDRVKENARLFGESRLRELHRTIFHGALHLCGYSDKTEGELQIMRQMEKRWLTKYHSFGKEIQARDKKHRVATSLNKQSRKGK